MEEKKEEEGTGADLSKYIVDPEKDGVAPEFKDGDGTDVLEKNPAEFKEPEGEAKTPKEVIKAEADKKKVKATEEKLKKVKAKTVIVPEVIAANQESKVEEAARYKKILIDLGFHLKEGTEEGKEQYVMNFGDLGVGRTFQAAFPTGKFWARKDGNFIDPVDVKELKVVKDFYAVRDGKKEITEVVQALDQAVAKRGESTSTENAESYKKGQEITRQKGSMKLEKKGIYYMVGGHKEPDAALVQQWANELGVSFKVMVAEQDNESAKAMVRAEKDGQYIESAVIHYFKTSRDVIALEIIEGMQRRRQNPIEGYREDGRPILSQETNYKIYKRVIRFMNFAIRDAITKAARIAALKILNRDWREPEEIASEAAEVRSVNAE